MFRNSSNQNIFNILSCIENSNINDQKNFMYIRSFVLELHQKPKSIL